MDEKEILKINKELSCEDLKELCRIFSNCQDMSDLYVERNIDLTEAGEKFLRMMHIYSAVDEYGEVYYKAEDGYWSESDWDDDREESIIDHFKNANFDIRVPIIIFTDDFVIDEEKSTEWNKQKVAELRKEEAEKEKLREELRIQIKRVEEETVKSYVLDCFECSHYVFEELYEQARLEARYEEWAEWGHKPSDSENIENILKVFEEHLDLFNRTMKRFAENHGVKRITVYEFFDKEAEWCSDKTNKGIIN